MNRFGQKSFGVIFSCVRLKWPVLGSGAVSLRDEVGWDGIFSCNCLEAVFGLIPRQKKNIKSFRQTGFQTKKRLVGLGGTKKLFILNIFEECHQMSWPPITNPQKDFKRLFIFLPKKVFCWKHFILFGSYVLSQTKRHTKLPAPDIEYGFLSLSCGVFFFFAHHRISLINTSLSFILACVSPNMSTKFDPVEKWKVVQNKRFFFNFQQLVSQKNYRQKLIEVRLRGILSRNSAHQ